MDTGQIITSVWAGAASLTVGILGYLHSKKVDATAAQAGVTSETRAGTAQIIDGLNGLVDQLQEDNTALREALRDQAKHYVERLDEIDRKCALMKTELDRFRRRYGDVIADNGSAVKPPSNDAPS